MANPFLDIANNATASTNPFSEIAAKALPPPQLDKLPTYGLTDQLASGATFGFADEIASGARTLSNLLTGNYAPGASMGEIYDQNLSNQREAMNRYESDSPIASFLSSVAGGAVLPTPQIMSKAKGATAALGNIAKSAGLGSFYGGLVGYGSGSGGVEQRLESAKMPAVYGGAIGGAIPLVQKGLEVSGNILGALKNSVYNNLVGNNSTANALPIALDETGQRAASMADATRQVSRQDINTQALDDAGFFDRLGFFNSPKTAALKLAQEIEPAGKALAKVTGQIAEKEAALVESGTPWVMDIVERGPQLDGVLAKAKNLKAQDAANATGLVKRVRNIQRLWENSDKSFGALKKIQEQFGAGFDQSFKPTSVADNNTHKINKAIYASLKKAITNRVDAIAPELSKEFKAANNLYSAASSLATPAFNAARKGGQGIPIVSKIPGASIAIKTAKDLSAVPLAKTLKKAESLAKNLSDVSITPRVLALINSADSSQEAPTSRQILDSLPKQNQSFSDLVDTTMTKAEDELTNPEAAKLEAPTVISARRFPIDQVHRLVPAVIAQESGKDPNAVSPAGAQGLMQLMPATGRELFKEAGLEGKYDPFDPEQNVTLGTFYLRKLLEQFNGDAELALTAYHSGPNRVKNLLKIHNGKTLADIKPHLGPVGREYAKSVTARLKKLGVVSV